MNRFRSRARLVVAALILACLPFAASADVQVSKAEFESCLSQHIPDERAKADPSVDTLIGDACKAEYDAFIRDLAPAERDAIKHAVRDIVHKKLTQ